MVASRETEAGQASGLPQGPRCPAGGGLSLERGPTSSAQAVRTARLPLPRRGSVDGGHCGPRTNGPATRVTWGWCLGCPLPGAGPSGTRAGPSAAPGYWPPRAWPPVVITKLYFFKRAAPAAEWGYRVITWGFGAGLAGPAALGPQEGGKAGTGACRAPGEGGLGLFLPGPLLSPLSASFAHLPSFPPLLAQLLPCLPRAPGLPAPLAGPHPAPPCLHCRS